MTAAQRAGAGPAGGVLRMLLRLCWAASLLWLAACAQPPLQRPDADNAWSGRLALQVEGQAEQSFSALFELQGTPDAGELVLISPLGSRIAQLTWRAGHARLTSGSASRESHSLDALLQEVTGTQIPVAALFSWLQGRPADVPGWSADLTQLADGRLSARRYEPAPPATLRIALVR